LIWGFSWYSVLPRAAADGCCFSIPGGILAMRALTVSLCLALSMLATGCAGDPSAPKRKASSTIPPSVSGGLTPAQVQASFERQMADLERVANTNWPGAGKVQVSFIVRPDGLPDSVQLIRNDFQSPELDLALTRMVQTMSFPPARSNTVVKAFPLYFR
jgi:hypothetical protein